MDLERGTKGGSLSAAPICHAMRVFLKSSLLYLRMKVVRFSLARWSAWLGLSLLRVKALVLEARYESVSCWSRAESMRARPRFLSVLMKVLVAVSAWSSRRAWCSRRVRLEEGLLSLPSYAVLTVVATPCIDRGPLRSLRPWVVGLRLGGSRGRLLQRAC